MTSSAVDVLAAAAATPSHAKWLVIEGRGDRTLTVCASVRGDDGDTHTFKLEIAARSDNTVSLHENVAMRSLPSACPERHINSDGSFCLGPEAEPIKTAARAETWWSELAGFLELQLRASETRKWPKAYSWPHGEAASAQKRLELEWSNLPTPVAKIIDQANVRSDGRLHSRRQRCPCGKKKQTRRCHEEAMLSIIKLRADVSRKEKAFWKSWSSPCCRTMDACPLNSSKSA
jgi:hypothetical protein